MLDPCIICDINIDSFMTKVTMQKYIEMNWLQDVNIIQRTA